MTGGELLCRTLEELGARCVFGLPGTQNVELFEALRRSRLRTVLATHELAASFMANGWARASGEPGVVFTIPGPGFTFAMPGLAEARLDSAPLLHVVGQPARAPGRRFQHQAIAQRAMVSPLVKVVIEVDEPDELAEAVRRAWRACLEGEPGPVVLHLGPDVIGAEARDATPPMDATSDPGPSARAAWAAPLGRRVRDARRPLLYLGQGAAGHPERVLRLVESWRAPVATTLSGRGVLPESHPWALAWEGLRAGVGPLNELIEGCDLVLAIGCKLGHNGSAGFRLALPEERLVHADRAADVLGANYPASMAIEADAGEVLAVAIEAADAGASSSWTDAEIAAWRRRMLEGDPPASEPRVHGVDLATPAALFEHLRNALPPEAIVVTDSGLHQYLVRRHYEVRGARGLVTPADFQSMAFGLPAAIGAALARPGVPVVAVIGDGGLLMSAMELVTAARERVPLTLVVFNDGQLNLIRHQQVRDWGHTHAVALRNPDMEGLARSLGVGYRLLEGDAGAVLRDAVAEGGPVLVEVRLGDSPSFRAERVKGVARATGRRLLGPGLIRLLKGALGR